MHNDDFEKIISLENLLDAWFIFKAGKGAKTDVLEFERNLEDNLFSLHLELKSGNYGHGKYAHFIVSDPKKRDIHKAEIRDRVVHQVLYDYLVGIYEPLFIQNSYSSRLGKGTHRVVLKLKQLAEEVSKKNFKRCYAMKFDVRKYFDSIDHGILITVLCKEIENENIRKLLKKVIVSFKGNLGKGIPLGNVTSQIFANIYLNELDQYVSKKLKIGYYYVRYADDFIILDYLEKRILDNAQKIKLFARQNLSLDIPKEKTVFRKLKWGIDFCGFIVLPNAILLRHKTKGKMSENIANAQRKCAKKEISISDFSKTINSYFGLLKHCDSYHLKSKIRSKYLYETIF